MVPPEVNEQDQQLGRATYSTGPGNGHDRAGLNDIEHGWRQSRLQACAERLAEARSKFTARLPEDERLNIGPNADVRQLMRSVEVAHASWSDKRKTTRMGKLQSKGEDWIACVHEHQNLLSLIPSEDKYVSVIVGTVAVLAKATVNHQAIGEAVSLVLEDLHEDLDYWKRQMELHGQNQVMQYYIIELYVIVFEMFTTIFIDWSRSRWQRFRHSFSPEWISNAIQDRRQRIEQLKQRLENEAKLSSEKIIHRDLVTKADLERIMHEHAIKSKDDIRQLLIDLMAILRLDRSASYLSSSPPVANNGLIEQAPALSVKLLEDNTDACNLAEIDLSPISRLTGRDEQVFLIEQCPPLYVTSELKSALEAWCDGNNSDVMWMEGSSDVETPSTNTTFAMRLLSAMSAAQAPTISHFCTHMTRAESPSAYYSYGLLSLVLDIVEQLWTTASQTVRTQLHDDMLQLTKDPTLLASATNMLSSLMQHKPRHLMCVIDNLNLLEDLEDREHIEQLRRVVKILTEGDAPGQNSNERSDRVCFTTDGFSDILGDYLQTDQLVHFSHDTSAGANEEVTFSD